jgi:hypothetical protein
MISASVGLLWCHPERSRFSGEERACPERKLSVSEAESNGDLPALGPWAAKTNVSR